MNDQTEKIMRINRFLARAGLGSRREVELLVQAGRVTVNDEVTTDLSTKIDIRKDRVTVDGNPVYLPEKYYYKCYKPRGVVSTMFDPQNRRCMRHIIAKHNIPRGVVPSGRLDLESEGLMILTNDGDLLQMLTHPKYMVRKTYRVLIDRWPLENDLRTLRFGVKCKDFFAKPSSMSRMGPQPSDGNNPVAGYWLEIVLREGKKREIREMLKVINYRVLRLVRIAHGGISIGACRPGEIIELGKSEIRILHESTAAG